MNKRRKFRKSNRLRYRIRNKIGPQLYSPRNKLRNCTWVFTIGDVDDNPSVPHAHAQEVGYRLNAWTGDIYPAGNERKKTIGNLTTRELKILHKDTKFLEFARKQIERYRSEYPHISFYVPKWFEEGYMRVCTARICKEDEVEVLIFRGKAIIQ